MAKKQNEKAETTPESVRQDVLKQHRQLDALFWQAADALSRALFKLLTLEKDDPASLKVRARVATAITICYDDGYTYHMERRLGGIQARPIILEHEHSDPGSIGTIREAVHFAASKDLAKLLGESVKSEPDEE